MPSTSTSSCSPKINFQQRQEDQDANLNPAAESAVSEFDELMMTMPLMAEPENEMVPIRVEAAKRRKQPTLVDCFLQAENADEGNI